MTQEETGFDPFLDTQVYSRRDANEMLESLAEELEEARDLIRRRLACDGSNGIWDAAKNFDLTQEMRDFLERAK